VIRGIKCHRTEAKGSAVDSCNRNIVQDFEEVSKSSKIEIKRDDVGATGCGVVDESVHDVDAYFRIGHGCWALSEIAFDAFESNSVRRRVRYLTFLLA